MTKLLGGAPKPHRQRQRGAAIARREAGWVRAAFAPYENPRAAVDLALARAVWDATNRSPEDDDGEPEHRD